VYTKREPIKRRSEGILLNASTSLNCRVLVLDKLEILLNSLIFS
jgi:hypothetical protein